MPTVLGYGFHRRHGEPRAQLQQDEDENSAIGEHE
ncbi:MAG: hypothetical protein ACI9DC_002997 [Gammaproteobacteria bacterium]|jgi:hypothetical protein